MRILGRYNVTQAYSDSEFEGESGGKKYIIFARKKQGANNANKDSIKDSGQDSIDDIALSNTLQNISSISHKNIMPFSIDEDETYFYFIKDKIDLKPLNHDMFLDKSPVNMYNFLNEDSKLKINYQKLLDCFLQITDALRYIHRLGYICKNLAPNNIMYIENLNIFKLEFGKSYFIDSNKINSTFLAPEVKANINNATNKSDIYSFGLIMLKMICDTLKINFKSDIDSIYTSAKDKMQKDLILLLKKCLLESADSRISLDSLEQELKSIYNEVSEIFNFELNLSNEVVKKYKEINNLLSDDEVIEHIMNRIAGEYSYWEFGEDRKLQEEIKIACGDLIFCCSPTKSVRYLYCFGILESQKILHQINQKGTKFNNEFTITTGHNHNNQCDSVGYMIETLKIKFNTEKLANKANEIDRKSIATEEVLLESEYKTIQSRKNTKNAAFRELKRGAEIIIFEILDSKDEIENADSNLDSTEAKEIPRDFKPKDKVIIESKDKKIEIKGIAEHYDRKTKYITIKIDSKYTHETYKKDIEYTISYDYQVEEIIWNKKNSALEALKAGNVAIPNLLRKINEPKELKENVLVDIPTYFNPNLDSNQKEAVIKALSLESGAEILLIQGPPGTGKTTTITEIIKQILNRHKHYRILIASQSNQAVDNVLEKLITDTQINGKMLRIGNDEKKISETGQKYMDIKVLDKMIKENIQRIKQNPIKDSNSLHKLQDLQDEFKNSLQKISDTLSQSSTKNKQLADLFLKNIRLIFGTLLGISSWKNFREMVFDVAIIDEAGRAVLSELLVPTIKARRIILVGDHKQLSPVVDDEIIENLPRANKESKYDKKDVSTSLFERLYIRMENAAKDKEYIHHFYHKLTYNYRAEPRICDIYSNAFYDSELISSELVKTQREHKLNMFKSSVVWINTNKLTNRFDRQKGSGKENPCHIGIIKESLNVLKDKILQSEIKDIGIITPYKAQMQLLKKELENIIKEYKKLDSKGISIDIGTIDSFQGSDRDLIIYDCVRSDAMKNDKLAQKQRKGAKITFIADEKRLNVSLSRSKRLLIIIGDMEFLESASVSEGENPFAKIIEYIKNNESYEIINLTDSKNKG